MATEHDDGGGLAVRALAAADREAWEPLWRGYQSFYGVDIPAEVTDLTWGRLLDPDEPMRGLLAFEAGTALGLGHLVFHRSTWTAGDYCYLQDLYVAPGTRGRGIGRQLIAAARAAAEIRGCSRLHWLTHETNVEAMRLYDAVAQRPGFVQYRILF